MSYSPLTKQKIKSPTLSYTLLLNTISYVFYFYIVSTILIVFVFFFHVLEQ
jgi:hypothetical protein